MSLAKAKRIARTILDDLDAADEVPMCKQRAAKLARLVLELPDTAPGKGARDE